MGNGPETDAAGLVQERGRLSRVSGGSRTPCSMEASQSGYESSDGIGPPMTPDLVYINGYLFKKTRTGKWQKR